MFFRLTKQASHRNVDILTAHLPIFPFGIQLIIMLKNISLVICLMAINCTCLALPKVENGTIDLTGVEFSQQKELQLNGQWEFIPHSFLYKDEKAITPNLVNVPGALNKQGFDAHGYGSYRLNIKHNYHKKLALKIPDIYTAYALYINGELIIEKGKPGRKVTQSSPRILLNTVPIDTKESELEIVIHVSNFHHRKFGITDPVIIGDHEYLSRNDDVMASFDIFLTGCLLMGSFFFLGLFYYGRKEVAAMYFALFCLCYAYRIIGWENYTLHELFPAYPWWLSIRVEYITLYMSGFFFARYVRHLFPDDTPILYAKGVEYLALLWSVLTIVLPVKYFTHLNIPWLFVMLVGLGIVFITYTRAIIRQRTGAKHSLYSIIGISVVFVLKSLAYLKLFEEPVSLTIVGQLVFFFFQGMILSELFSSSWKLAKQKAEEAAKAKTDFLSIMSHEIRTPLNAVIGTTYHMIDEGPREDQKKDLNDLKTSSENLLSLINNILDFNKIDAGKIDFEYEHVVFKDFIEGIVFSQKQTASQKDIKLHCKVDTAIPEVMVLDKTRFIQILTNLVGNAIKFTNEGSVEIRVRNQMQAGSSCNLLFEIIDTGIGIPKEKHEKIFNVFEQANTSVSRNYGGTGLGLSITAKLLHLMGSELRLESEEGKGARFYFDVNLEIGDEEQVVVMSNGNFDLEGTNVLLVEDNDLNALIATRLLNKWNCNVDVAKNGLIAVENNQRKTYDIILMDIQMPTMDGYTASKKIREGGYKLPIIALTASAAFEKKEDLSESGIDDVVTKPFEPGNLYNTMRGLLNKQTSAA